MKKLLFLGACLVWLLSQNVALAQSYANLEFIENKGQWNSQVKFKGEMPTGAFFLKNNGFTVVQHNLDDLETLADVTHGHSHDTTVKLTLDSKARKLRSGKPSSLNELVLRSHAYNVSFLNAGNASISGDKATNSVNNYFIGNDPKQWAANCKLFQAVTYQNLYPNIDVRYYTANGSLKYDIIVKPGADISRLAMQYEGVDGLQLKNESLIIKTSVGEMKELAPYSYQIENGVKKEVGCRFKITGNIVQFKLDGYSKDAVLVIDPQLIFSTFTGSSADNWGYTATYGPDGSFYAGGIVFGTGFPTSPGAYQTSFGGGSNEGGKIGPHDMGIIKFSANGQTRMYATYIGGSANEQPHSLVVDGQGNLILAGRSSSDNYPATAPIYGAGGRYDIVITKLNATGSAILGSRRFGGSGDDGVNILPKHEGQGAISIRRNYGDDARSEVILDASNNIYLASCTQSPQFPTTSGSFQPNNGGSIQNASRFQDGVLLKVSPNVGTVLFSSFLGGTDDDAAFVLSLHPVTNNIYVGGSTVSNNFPGVGNGPVISSSFKGGACDGFVSIISNDGSTLIKSTYIGAGGDDMLYGVQFDRFGFPYVMGTTTQSHPVINAAFSQTGGKQFISKVKADLSAYEYSTNFGTNSATPNLSPTAFLVDRCERVYVSGWGGSINTAAAAPYPNATTTGLTVTPDAFQSTTDGSDFYFFVLEKNAATQLFGSFFGQRGGRTGEHVDGGTSRFDNLGVIYQALCANCGGGATFPTTPGVWSPSNGSNNCNLAAVKIAFNLSGVANSITPSINGVARDSSGCIPLTVDFRDTVGVGKQYVWSFGDGSADVTTTTPNVSHTYSNIGVYRVRLISVDSTTCNISDTAYTTITARNDEAALGFDPVKLPPCQSTSYQFFNTSIAPAGKPFKPGGFTWNFGDNSPLLVAGNQPVTHAYAGVGTYRVVLTLTDTNYCNAPDSIVRTIRISPNVKASFETPASGCAPHNAVFKNTSAGGQSFFWDFGDGSTSTQSDPVHQYLTPGTYTVRMRAVDSATCNISDSTSFTIVVSDKPTAAFIYAPTQPEENTAVIFNNNSIGAVSYKWIFGDGDSLSTNSIAPVSHIYNATGTFNTCLVAINQYGCRDTVCQPVKAIVVPALDVSNAFTPNGDGVNDKVFVRGFGINKMVWRIFNRWGTLIYQSANKSQGWDGTYKGVMQPKEVYTYVLDIEFTDGTKYTKKGDITLL